MTNWETRGRLRTSRRDYKSFLAWKRLGTSQEELKDMVAGKDICSASWYHDWDQISSRNLVILYIMCYLFELLKRKDLENEVHVDCIGPLKKKKCI